MEEEVGAGSRRTERAESRVSKMAGECIRMVPANLALLGGHVTLGMVFGYTASQAFQRRALSHAANCFLSEGYLEEELDEIAGGFQPEEWATDLP